MLLANTLSCGGMLALGDFLQQCREIYKEPGRERSWRRTGESDGSHAVSNIVML